ncbi:hypothetical protein Btru_026246 [Bulinus truncatus]|nr:hypothetical protein Btru_026246 [Bulinus truncatus]
MTSDDDNYMEIVMEHLKETFLKYLQPEQIITKFIQDGKLNEEFLTQNELNRKELVQAFLEWLLESNKSPEMVGYFISSLKELSNKSNIIRMIDGTLIKELGRDDLTNILEKMVNYKFILEQNAKLCCKTVKDSEFRYEIFRSIKTCKPDWPFYFINIINTIKPQILSINSQVIVSESSMNSDNDQDCCHCPPLTLDNGLNLTASGATTGKTAPDVIKSNSSIIASNIMIPYPEYEGEKYDPKEFSGPLSMSPSDFSELSLDYFDTRNHVSGTREVTEEEWNSAEFKVLLNKRVFEEKFITVIQDFDVLSQNIDDDSVTHSDNEYELDENLSKGKTKIKPMNEAHQLNLRQYQIELAEKAVQGLNTVICAPTGSGKTRVATHIILEHLKQNKKKTVAFLARTIPLTVQQFKVLRNSLPSCYKVTYITGQSQDSLELKTFVKRNNVVVLTPMILVNHLRKKSVLMRHFSLIIFDECHHTRKEEPYNILMFMYLQAKLKGSEKIRSSLPQIVGLSASIGVDRARNMEEAANNILKICELNDQLIKELAGKIPRNKKRQEYGQWAVDLKNAAKSVPINDVSRETQEPVRTLIIIADYLWTYSVALETHDLVELTDVMGYLEKCFEKFSNKEGRTDKEDIFYVFFESLLQLVKRRYVEDNENLETLAQILDVNIVQKGKDSRGIIFVRTRALAEALSSWLNRCGIKELEDFNASIFTGTNAKEEEGGMSQAQQEVTIRKFKSGEIRLLVATSVAEEGLDIPECNLVIKYNHVGNEITTVQTKGRSRKAGGVSFLLAMDHILRREYVNRDKEKLMKKAFEKIDAMAVSDREVFIHKYQTELMQDAEIEEALAARRQKRFRDVDFTMVCSLCRKIRIRKENIRVIFDKFRVSIDKDLLDGKFVKCIPMKSQYIDEMELIGTVFCRGEPHPGRYCGHKLGTMIKYGKVYYFAMGIKNFGFHRNSLEKLEHYKKWKDVPYFVETLNIDDIKRYLQILPKENNAVFDDEESSEDDDRSKLKNLPDQCEKRINSDNDLRSVTDFNSTLAEQTQGDERNSVTYDDIRYTKADKGFTSGSFVEKAETLLAKSPSLTSSMKDDIDILHLPSVSSVKLSESCSEDID